MTSESSDSWLDTDVEESDKDSSGSEDDDDFALEVLQKLTSPVFICAGASGNRFTFVETTGVNVPLRQDDLMSYLSASWRSKITDISRKSA